MRSDSRRGCFLVWFPSPLSPRNLPASLQATYCSWSSARYRPPCPVGPGAQLHFLMVCTGESRQWLPPQGPRNTSGHIVCKDKRRSLVKHEQKTASLGDHMVPIKARGFLNLLSRFLSHLGWKPNFLLCRGNCFLRKSHVGTVQRKLLSTSAWKQLTQGFGGRGHRKSNDN